MIALPTFAPNALEQTHAQFTDLLTFNDHEKWLTGQFGLFLSALDTLNLDALSQHVTDLNRGGINDTYRAALDKWTATFTGDVADNVLSTGLHVSDGHVFDDEEKWKLMLSVEAQPYGYDIKPLADLSETDRDVVVHCIAEARAVFLYSPNVTDLVDIASYRIEVFEELDEWLPNTVRSQGIEAIRQYYEANRDDFESSEFFDDDDLLDDYASYLTPLPEWVSALNNGIGDKDPFAALDKLKQLQGKAENPQVAALLKDTTLSLTDFLGHFPDLPAWLEFTKDCETLSEGVESDNPPIDWAFMLAWGVDGFWWSVQSDIVTGMMEAGEEPTMTVWADEQYSHSAKLAVEQVYRGSALLYKMAILTESIEQNLPESQPMDNRG